MSSNENPDPTKDPVFTMVSQNDPEFLAACDRAYETLPRFIELIQAQGENTLCSAKLRFRDPDDSDRVGEDRFIFLWLTGIHYYPDENCFSGVFFELPAELRRWFERAASRVWERFDL